MLASTCLAVLFVPSLFVVIQRFEEWRKSRKAAKAEAAKAYRLTGPIWVNACGKWLQS